MIWGLRRPGPCHRSTEAGAAPHVPCCGLEQRRSPTEVRARVGLQLSASSWAVVDLTRRGRWMADGDPLPCHRYPCNKGGKAALVVLFHPILRSAVRCLRSSRRRVLDSPPTVLKVGKVFLEPWIGGDPVRRIHKHQPMHVALRGRVAKLRFQLTPQDVSKLRFPWCWRDREFQDGFDWKTTR